MPNQELRHHFADTERQFIPDEYRRRRICQPTDFTSFKSPALLASVEIPVAITVQTSRFTGTINRIYLDGYDAELEIPARNANHPRGVEPSAVQLIGARATIKGQGKSPENSLISGQHSVEITMVRRTSEVKVVIRMKDLDLPAKRYAQRLAFLLNTDVPRADQAT